MKRIVSIILLVLYGTFPYIAAENTEVPSTIELIKENTYKTAVHTEKGQMEYVAWGVSILACIIAIITLYVSIRTYKAQKRTERNTFRWSAKLERAYLRKTIYDLFVNYRKLTAISKMIAKDIRPSASCFFNMKIDANGLHADEYFGDDLDYNGLRKIKLLINQYNSMIDNRIAQAENSIYNWERYGYSYLMGAYPVEGFEDFKLIIEIIYTIGQTYTRMFDNNEKDRFNDKRKKELLLNFYDIHKYILKDERGWAEEDGLFYFGHIFPTEYKGLWDVPLEYIQNVLDKDSCDAFWQTPYLLYLASIKSKNKHRINDILKEMKSETYYENQTSLINRIQEIFDSPSKLISDSNCLTEPHCLPMSDYGFINIILTCIKIDGYGYDIKNNNELLSSEQDIEPTKSEDIYDATSHTYYLQVTHDTYVDLMYKSSITMTIPLKNKNYININEIDTWNLQFINITYATKDYKDVATFKVNSHKVIDNKLELEIGEKINFKRI